MAFDFSEYLIGKSLGVMWCNSRYNLIDVATLIDEKTQEYRVRMPELVDRPPYGLQPTGNYFYFDVRIGETRVTRNYEPWTWCAVGCCQGILVTRYSWSDIGISESEWDAYKRWLIEKECVLSDFAW